MPHLWLAVPKQEDLELESGEYFLAQAERSKRHKVSMQAQQADRVADKKRKRLEAFAPPKVRPFPTQ
jgi:ribosomal RNA assembly protein